MKNCIKIQEKSQIEKNVSKKLNKMQKSVALICQTEKRSIKNRNVIVMSECQKFHTKEQTCSKSTVFNKMSKLKLKIPAIISNDLTFGGSKMQAKLLAVKIGGRTRCHY